MPVVFKDSTFQQCKNPISGRGENMLICGEPVRPGRSYCDDCYSRLYIPLATGKRALKAVVEASSRNQRMTVPLSTDADL